MRKYIIRLVIGFVLFFVCMLLLAVLNPQSKWLIALSAILLIAVYAVMCYKTERDIYRYYKDKNNTGRYPVSNIRATIYPEASIARDNEDINDINDQALQDHRDSWREYNDMIANDAMYEAIDDIILGNNTNDNNTVAVKRTRKPRTPKVFIVNSKDIEVNNLTAKHYMDKLDDYVADGYIEQRNADVDSRIAYIQAIANRNISI